MKRMKAVISMAAVCAAAVSVYAGKKREEEDSFLTAVARGNVAETQRLIASGADVNAAAHPAAHALHCAGMERPGIILLPGTGRFSV